MSAERKKTIVALDDSEIVLDVLKIVLEAQGYAVHTASTLAHFEAQLERVTPDLIVLDVQMPEAFGDDVGRVILAMHGIQVPVLLFSSLDKENLAARVRDASLAGFVSKDDGVEALADRIVAMLGAPT